MTNGEFHILYADDNQGDLDLMREALEEGGGSVRLHTVNDGDEALDFLFRRGRHRAAPKPHITILDLNMPKKSGMETLEAIKGDDALHRMPVIIFTSSTAPGDLLGAYRAKANAYVIKPSELDDFIHVIQRLKLFWCKIATVLH